MSYRSVGRAFAVSAALLSCAACGDTPITPEELGAAQSASRVPVDRMADRELLLAVLAKLDALEVRLERERAEMYMKLDSLATTGAILVAAPQAYGMASAPKLNMSEQIDSIYNWTDGIWDLTSYMAEDQFGLFQGAELCGHLEGATGMEFDLEAQAEAEGEAGVGVKPLETGAAATAAIKTSANGEAQAEWEAGLGLELCWDLSSSLEDPPVRAQSAARMARAAPASQLETTIMGLRTQLGFDEQALERALVTGTSVLRSGDLRRLADIAPALPLPAAMRDPLALVRGHLTTFDPVLLLCGGTNFGGRFTGLVSQGCGHIQNNDLPQLEPFLRVGSNLADLRTRFSNLGDDFNALVDDFDVLDANVDGLQTRFAGVCSRMNTMVDRRLRVDVDMPWGNDRVLDVRLFPTDWRVTC
jgi:hypothetical protein